MKNATQQALWYPEKHAPMLKNHGRASTGSSSKITTSIDQGQQNSKIKKEKEIMGQNEYESDSSSVMKICYQYCVKGCFDSLRGKCGNSSSSSNSSRRREHQPFLTETIKTKQDSSSNLEIGLRKLAETTGFETELSSIIGSSSHDISESQSSFTSRDVMIRDTLSTDNNQVVASAVTSVNNSKNISGTINTESTSLLHLRRRVRKRTDNDSNSVDFNNNSNAFKDEKKLSLKGSTSSLPSISMVDRQNTISTYCGNTDDDDNEQIDDSNCQDNFNNSLQSFLTKTHDESAGDNRSEDVYSVDSNENAFSRNESLPNYHHQEQQARKSSSSDEGGGFVNDLKRHFNINKNSRDGMVEMKRLQKQGSARNKYQRSIDGQSSNYYASDTSLDCDSISDGSVNEGSEPTRYRLHEVIQLLISEDPTWVRDSSDSSSSSWSDGTSNLDYPSRLKKDEEDSKAPENGSLVANAPYISGTSDVVQEAKDAIENMLDEQLKLQHQIQSSSSLQ